MQKVGLFQVHWPHKTKVKHFIKCLKCSLKAGIEFSLFKESVSRDTSTQTNDCEILNNTYTEVSQNKSSNTEEVLNKSNITAINQPTQDLFHNNNNFLWENVVGTPEKWRPGFRRSQLDSKDWVSDTCKPKSGSVVVTTKGEEKPSKNNISTVDNLPLNL